MRECAAIRQDARERRQQPRHATPIKITIFGQTVACANWSLSGFAATGFTAAVNPGDTVVGTLEAGKTSGPFVARVVHSDAARGDVGVQFVEIDPAIFGAMLYVSRRNP